MDPTTHRIDCAHCGLPVPAGGPRDDGGRWFCCSGCALAFEIIHDAHLEGYYRVRQRLEAEAQPATSSGRAFTELDDPAFTERAVTVLEDGLLRTELLLEGVHCAACVWLLERVPVAVAGAVEVRLDLARSLATVVWDPGRTTLSTVARFLDTIGYTPHPFRGREARDIARRDERSLLIRIAIAGALAGNVMVIAFALYGGHFHGMAEQHLRLFRWVSLGLAVPSVFWCGLPFLRGALGALRTRTLHMDLPIAIGILAGFSQGAANTVLGRGEVYFDSVAVLVFLLLVGRFVQHRQQRSAASASELLFSLSPSSATRLDASGPTQVPVDALRTGDRVRVLPGETIPVDGVVSEGASTVDRSLLTGESRPEPAQAGDPVHAGTVNAASPLVIETISTGDATRLARLMRLVEHGARHRAPVQILADRISGWFVAAVILAAAATLAFWWPSGSETAVNHAVALLIVACPCALGLATPLAVGAALAQAARRGLLVKSGAALEVLARSGVMLLDKTGTLTRGRPGIVRTAGDSSLIEAAAALERTVAHPVAAALVEAAEEAPLDVREVHNTPGSGITGRVDGHNITAGRTEWVTEKHRISDDLAADAAGFRAAGLTTVLVARDGAVGLVVGIDDALRTDSPTAVEALHRFGWVPSIVSGDDPAVVRAVAEALDIPSDRAHGGVAPEHKIDHVRAVSDGGPVVMVGDGVNDAAALAAATVGVAVHGGAEAALTAADIYLTRPGLMPVVDLVRGARRTLRVIRRNLVLSLAYNVVMVSLAATGHMSPIVAAILMPASSLTVVISSYRARTFRE
jgi:Cu2+-exporting ATPase